MTSPRDQIEPRKPLSRMQFAHLALEQGGLCGCGCGGVLTFLKPRSVIDEHIRPLSMLGGNDLDNRSLWLAGCAKAKTSGEAAILAKAKRLAGETGQRVRRQRRGGSSIKSNPKIANRGFSKAPAGHSAWGKRTSNAKDVNA